MSGWVILWQCYQENRTRFHEDYVFLRFPQPSLCPVSDIYSCASGALVWQWGDGIPAAFGMGS